MKNEMELTFLSISKNESFARSTVASFIAQIDPTLDELTEVKTVVSEAVTNAIIHGYEEKDNGRITIRCVITNQKEVDLTIIDYGVGIENINMAKEPLYTSKPQLERSGMGFSIMESFMDHLTIESTVGVGTTVYMRKQFSEVKSACH